MKTKQETRRYIASLFTDLEMEELIEKSRDIGEQIIKYIKAKKIEHICIYESMSDEVETKPLIEKLSEKGYKIYTPQMISETEMILINKHYEIYEKEIDLFIVPGRAFTIAGKRLGRGKGYYDRFLSQQIYKKSLKMGICYEFQVLKELETNKHDKDMDIIITNTTGK